MYIYQQFPNINAPSALLGGLLKYPDTWDSHACNLRVWGGPGNMRRHKFPRWYDTHRVPRPKAGDCPPPSFHCTQS